MTNWGWNLPPGVTDRDIDEAYGEGEERCEHGLVVGREWCHDCGDEPPPTESLTEPSEQSQRAAIMGQLGAERRFSEEGKRLTETLDRIKRPMSAQQSRAFAVLDAIPSAPWLPIGELVAKLWCFGHSDMWAADMAWKWAKLNSKVVK